MPSSFGWWSGAIAGVFCGSQGTLHQGSSVGTAGGEVATGQSSWSTLCRRQPGRTANDEVHAGHGSWGILYRALPVVELEVKHVGAGKCPRVFCARSSLAGWQELN